LKTIAEREKFEYDYVFDWVIKKQENDKMKSEGEDIDVNKQGQSSLKNNIADDKQGKIQNNY
jgi:hypothetical protein